MKTKYFLYARKSTEDEERQVMSIEAQLVELAEFAKRENIEIIEQFIESKSAKKPGRKVFNEMMEKVHASRESIGLLAWHPDRLARNSIDGGQIIYLIDQEKIASLRFPTFWFEPTPQGLFMLQVAFGQSKYYSDNLSENVKRGKRQKLRRGEYPGKAPLGYVNNPKTRNIDVDPVKSKITQKAFEEFANGKHSLKSLGERLSFWGVVSSTGKSLAKATIQRMLTQQAYIGLIVENGETYEGNFKPIVSRATFEMVQKVLKERGRPRKTRNGHDFPFVGLLQCGECGAMITAQWAKGKYRYYRCTKKHGKCSQSYLNEDLLAKQLKKEISKVALGEDWTNQMLAKVDEWEKEQELSSHAFAKNLGKEIAETEKKLDKLVSAYLDGIVDKDIYLAKKNELIKTKTALLDKKGDFGRKGNNWLELLRNWIKSLNHAEKLALSKDFYEIKIFLEKIGTNRKMLNKTILFDFVRPYDLIPKYMGFCERSSAPAERSEQTLSLKNSESFVLSKILNEARTFFERQSAH
ncbi:MAG: hypothetical protein CMF78_02665 [Candidatus Marinimicrobia bacterium]|nr:hypothetical protein [Candidatus Neomarinimicrobiota bacterium]